MPRLSHGDNGRVLEIIEKLQVTREKENIEKLFVIAWGLWTRRNKLVFEAQLQHPNDTLRQALLVYSDYQKARGKAKGENAQMTKWKSPNQE